jgi:hypothetical protein
MDPDEALRVAREATAKLLEDDEAMPYDAQAELASDLAAAFDALDEWLTKGGFAPADWRKAFTK